MNLPRARFAPAGHREGDRLLEERLYEVATQTKHRVHQRATERRGVRMENENFVTLLDKAAKKRPRRVSDLSP